MISDSNRKLKKGNKPIFIQRPVPSEKQVEIFERAVKREARQEEIDDNLSEIYLDKKGKMVDVSHLHHEKSSFLVAMIKRLFVLAVLIVLGYGFYSYFSNKSLDSASIDLAISAPEQIKAGEDFSYIVHYKNRSKLSLNALRLELKYPDNFIVSEVTGDGLVPASTGTVENYFSLPSLNPGGEANVVVKGKIISKKDTANLLSADLSYQPGEFSTEFKKEAVASVLVNDLGFDLNFEYANAALVGDSNEIDLNFSNVKSNFLDDFEVSFMFPENIILINAPTPVNASSTVTALATSSELKLATDKTSDLIWRSYGLTPSDKNYILPVYYKVKKKVDDNQTIIIRLSKKLDNGKSYVFAEKTIDLNVMNSNLNLTLILNGSKNDNTANFSDTLNYTLTYANKSDGPLSNVAIMAVLKGDFLDWSSLKDVKKGQQGENTITWTKEQIPDLANLAPGEEGTIDFSIGIRPYNSSDLGKSFTVQSYGQFNVNNRQGGLSDSKSNNIITKINSDLNLQEKVLYFDENNTPVGSGPLPPKVGQKTSVKVYWTLENNLHALQDVRVITKLPDYISYDNKSNVSVGNLSFDEASHSVIWNIGSLPVSVYQAKADFNISLTPLENQRNSLLVLLSGSTVSAVDSDTKSPLNKTTNSKTTKLEDDDIANLNNSGLVQ
ncbi:MAG: hypothetical protein WCK59_03515 [Candidatus Falkowbacteria bacterium]